MKGERQLRSPACRMIWYAAAILLLICLTAGCGEPNTGDASRDVKPADASHSGDGKSDDGQSAPNNTNQPATPNKEAQADPKQEAPAEAAKEPITLKLYNPFGTSLSEDYLREHIEVPVQAAYPHIQFDILANTESSINNLIIAGNIPDIILGTVSTIQSNKDLELTEELTPLIAKHRVDLSVLEDGVMDAIRIYSGNNEILAMPWGMNQASLYYNMDLFDQFGVSYPKDGMTWSELAHLARLMSRTVDGERIRGFDMAYSFLFQFNQLSAPFVNPETETAAVNTDQWRKLFQTFGDLYFIPGNEVDGSTPSDVNGFVVEQNVAMRAGNSMFPRLIDLESKGQSFRWDIVSLPAFAEAPSIGTQANITTFSISSQSAYKDEAMQALAQLLTYEAQLQGSLIARQTVLANADVQKQFGQSDDIMKDKNITAVAALAIAPTPPVTPYDAIARSVINQKFKDVRTGMKDINTALREAEEEINSKISEAKKTTE